jgi:undecaprenyl-diphosphatase
MPWYHSFLLGVIQALTEFLPVSSSGHLAIYELYFDVRANLAFDVTLHVGTALATICFYYRRILWILSGTLTWCRQKLKISVDPDSSAGDAAHLAGMILLTTIITAALALPLKDLFEFIKHSPPLVALAFLITALVLWSTRKHQAASENEGLKTVTLKIAILIGIAQFAAVTPGISRSGTTIAAALLLGLQRNRAAEYSFLISIPAILGAAATDVLGGQLSTDWGIVLWGLIAAFVFGLGSLWLLVQLVRRGNFYMFSFYLVPLSALVLIGWLAGLFPV